MKQGRSSSIIIRKITLIAAILGSVASIAGLGITFIDSIAELGPLFIGILGSLVGALIAYILILADASQSFAGQRGQHRVFISYTHADTEFVMRLVNDLQKMNLEPIFDRLELKVGDNIRKAVDNMIDQSDYFIFVASEKSATSNWARKELEQAVSRGKKILPVVLNTQELPEPLSWVRYANFSQSYEKGLAQLKTAFGGKADESVLVE